VARLAGLALLAAGLLCFPWDRGQARENYYGNCGHLSPGKVLVYYGPDCVEDP
jgi:hypothetical protein